MTSEWVCRRNAVAHCLATAHAIYLRITETTHSISIAFQNTCALYLKMRLVEVWLFFRSSRLAQLSRFSTVHDPRGLLKVRSTCTMGFKYCLKHLFDAHLFDAHKSRVGTEGRHGIRVERWYSVSATAQWLELIGAIAEAKFQVLHQIHINCDVESDLESAFCSVTQSRPAEGWAYISFHYLDAFTLLLSPWL